MTRLRIGMFLGVLLLGSAPLWALGSPIDPAAGAWVITTDIAPFVVRKASVSTGGLGLYQGFFGADPQNVSAGASYRDEARGMLVGVGVIFQQQTTFLDHQVEAQYRNSTTGRMHPESSVISLFGQAVFFYCDRPPACRERQYSWRSDPQTVVTVTASALLDLGPPDGAPQPQQIPCPEPTEILQAYLTRCPSALSVFSDGDDRAKQWRRDQTALELAAAEFQLDQAASAPPATRLQVIAAARSHLVSFAELRRAAFGGASAATETERIEASRGLPPDAQLQELNKIRQQYRQWWNMHQNDPVFLPTP